MLSEMTVWSPLQCSQGTGDTLLSPSILAANDQFYGRDYIYEETCCTTTQHVMRVCPATNCVLIASEISICFAVHCKDGMMLRPATEVKGEWQVPKLAIIDT